MKKQLPKATEEIVNKQQELLQNLNDYESNYYLEDIQWELRELLYEYSFEPTVYFENGLCGLKGVLNNIILTAEYDKIEFTEVFVENDSTVAVCKDGKWAIAVTDGSNNILCPFKYDKIHMVDVLNRRVTIAEAEGKYGYINCISGKEISEIEFDDIYSSANLINSVKETYKMEDWLNSECSDSDVETSAEEVYIDDDKINYYYHPAFGTNGVYSIFRKGELFGITDGLCFITPAIYDDIEEEVAPDYPIRLTYKGENGYLDKNAEFTTDKTKAHIWWEV